MVYWMSQSSVQLFLKFFVRFRSYGAWENVPRTGGCILAANHASYLDPPAIGCGVNHRIVQMMARDTLYINSAVRWWMLKVHTIPIDRTKGDVAALRKAISSLREGKVVAIFPEGTRTLDGKLQPAKGGIGFLIAKAEVPVVPVYIHGTFEAYPKGAKKIRRVPVSIHFGKPIYPEELQKLGDDRSVYDKIGNLVMERIAELQKSMPST